MGRFGRGRGFWPGWGYGRGWFGPGWGRGNPYPFCRFFPWLPRRWWAFGYPYFRPWVPYIPYGPWW